MYLYSCFFNSGVLLGLSLFLRTSALYWHVLYTLGSSLHVSDVNREPPMRVLG